MPRQTRLLTKSGYTQGLGCDRLLWIYQNLRDELPEVDEGTQAIFDQGHQIGDLAKTLYPNGIEIDWSAGQENGIVQTRECFRSRRPLFEAGFVHGRTHARADILEPLSRGSWDLIEVKSSGEVKEEHLDDVAFQKHVYEGAGIRIRRCFVMHVNKDYERNGKLKPDRLLTSENVTREVGPIAKEVPSEIQRMLGVIARRKCPEPEIGPWCTGCCLYDECWFFLPDRNVFYLMGGGQKNYNLMDEGILRVADIPRDYPLTERQQIQVVCEKTGKPHIEREKLRDFLNRFKYPLYFLDFETFNIAIPPYDYLKPYENVPFQYSLHVVESPGRPPRHDSYLSAGAADPRPELMDRLRSRLGKAGSVVAYNAAFESGVLKHCADHFPQFANWVESILGRIVDLYAPFRNLHYYHPSQNGRTTLKDVLPVLTRGNYANLPIADGTTASLRFRDMAFGNMDEAEKLKTRKALEQYCCRDSSGMVLILGALRRLCR